MLCAVNIEYSSSYTTAQHERSRVTCKSLSLNFSFHRSTVLCSIHYDDVRFTSILSILVPSMTSAMRCSCNFLCNSNVYFPPFFVLITIVPEPILPYRLCCSMSCFLNLKSSSFKEISSLVILYSETSREILPSSSFLVMLNSAL